MTVSTVVDHNDYTGNGVTTSFPYTFRIFQKTDLTVSVLDLSGTLIVLVLDADYTVTNAGGYSGGNVVLTAPLENGWKISIARELEVTQETDLRNQGKFFAEVHENAFDKLTMLIQQVSTLFRLALRKPSSIANWYEAEGNRIQNLADPSAEMDSVNKRSMVSYVEEKISGVIGGFGYFLQKGVGAVMRTFQDKMRDIVSVKDFGAVGDGSTDDTASIQAAINALFPEGGTLYLPKGIYKITNQLNISNMPVKIQGEGMMSTVIIQAGVNKNGISFISNTSGNAPSTNNLLINTLQISDISINKGASGGGIAVDAQWLLMTSNSAQFITERFRVYSHGNAEFCWAGAVRLVNCNGVRISKTQLHGNPLESVLTAADPYTMKYGLQFVNQTDALGLISFFIDSLTVICASRGIQVYGWHEGFEIVNSELVQTNTGIEVFGNATHLNPDFFYLNSHIEARQNAVSLSNVFKPKFVGCDLFKSTFGTPVSGSIVSLNQCNFATFSGTTFSSNDATVTEQGITTDVNSYHGNVTGCSFIGFDNTSGSSGINLVGSEWLIDGNNFYLCNAGVRVFGNNNEIGVNHYKDCASKVLDAGSSNLLRPRQFITDYTWTASTGTDQAFLVTIPSGIFSTTPEVAFAIPIQNGGLNITICYDRGNSDATHLRFVVKSATSISAGTYIIGILASSKQ
ncbi:glycosyl hydrolase family 28-related protein [Enterobacter roggenkampii]|uniref:glycosyl hydrolase family 28-related protein n=1 Tax=Enterobacter roggenkampii TaxID=1812935 RepID=UPI0022E5FD56|nr:glycosyl hydrolase family 28-related protein [Enterobacter roggenkampii]